MTNLNILGACITNPDKNIGIRNFIFNLISLRSLSYMKLGLNYGHHEIDNKARYFHNRLTVATIRYRIVYAKARLFSRSRSQLLEAVYRI